MDILVRREGDLYVADWGAGRRRCAVGAGGIGEKLCEGDGLTPLGRWPLRRVLYRADRMQAPKTQLPLAIIAPDDAWCDIPDDPHYNQPVKLPYPSLDERLWREDSLYDVIVVVGFNDSPVMAGKGSAIFLHLARSDFRSTQGCIALNRDDLLDAVAQLALSDCLHVKA